MEACLFLSSKYWIFTIYRIADENQEKIVIGFSSIIQPEKSGWRDKESTPPEEGERGKKIRLVEVDERRRERPERERREDEEYSKAIRKAAQGTPKV